MDPPKQATQVTLFDPGTANSRFCSIFLEAQQPPYLSFSDAFDDGYGWITNTLGHHPSLRLVVEHHPKPGYAPHSHCAMNSQWTI